MKNEWVDLETFDIELLSKEFQSSLPFNHIVIDNFFKEEKLNLVLSEFDNENFELWDKRDHADVQVKWRSNWKSDLDVPPTTFSFIQYLNSGDFLRFLIKLTGIEGIIPDPYLSGGGFNQINPGGVLEIHADGNWHDLMGVHRRLNVILYLNKDWNCDWGGDLELWSKTADNLPNKCIKRIAPFFNRLCVFKTGDFSYHGHPTPLSCPVGKNRRSLILYYYTNTRPINEVLSIDNKHRALFYNTKDKAL